MATYLVFHRNMVTKDDFATPVDADSKQAAMDALADRYPHPAYVPLTCFEKSALQGILDDADRWPGVASTPQPTLEQLLTRVTARVGKLPPLPNRKPSEQPSAKVSQATGGHVERVRDPAPFTTPTPVPNAAKAPVSVLEALKASKTMKGLSSAQQTPVSKATMASSKPSAKAPSSLLATPPAANGRSVIDVLRALRG